MSATRQRCDWCGDDPLYVAYHDNDWGVPVHDDRMLFEMLTLEGAQAGLSWITILRKREAYREAFDNFDLNTIASYRNADLERLLKNERVVRNRLKLASVATNARAVVQIQEQHGSFSNFLWHFVDGSPVQNQWASAEDVPAQTPLSARLSKELKRHGCSFVGPTICYAFMQSIGMVNDHLVSCYRHRQLGG